MLQIASDSQAGTLAGGSIVDGKLQIERLEKSVPDEAAAFVLKLYEHIPSVRITDILLEVNEKLGFTDAFTDLRTGVACNDRIGVLTVLLADDVNLGLRRMADACAYGHLLGIAADRKMAHATGNSCAGACHDCRGTIRTANGAALGRSNNIVFRWSALPSGIDRRGAECRQCAVWQTQQGYQPIAMFPTNIRPSRRRSFQRPPHEAPISWTAFCKTKLVNKSVNTMLIPAASPITSLPSALSSAIGLLQETGICRKSDYILPLRAKCRPAFNPFLAARSMSA